jgi:hypothetical protein
LDDFRGHGGCCGNIPSKVFIPFEQRMIGSLGSKPNLASLALSEGSRRPLTWRRPA